MKLVSGFLVILFLAFFNLQSLSQTPAHCGTVPYLTEQLNEDANLKSRIENSELLLKNWIQDHPQNKTLGGIVVIPVVVHVVHKFPVQNITDAQIFSQLDVLNEDFRRLNADTVLTLQEFDTLAADCEIEFCLALRDPSGLPSTGITRTFSVFGPSGGFTTNDDVKFTAMGGIDAWPTDQYLNIWVCNLAMGIAGYASFPGEDSATNGVVIDYQAFGSEGTVISPFNKGRTGTHEIGHWLNLYHIWGDDPGCAVDDSVSDTPLSGNSNFGCDTTANSCVDTPFDYHDMVQNYMDYSDDSCMNLFTHGQKARMHAAINVSRPNLLTSDGCLFVSSGNPHDETKVQIFPNPGNGFFTIQISPALSGEKQVRVFDCAGMPVYTSTENKNEFHLSMVDFPSGIYFLQIESGKNTTNMKIILLP